ncbi:MAG: GTPase ObgE [Actinobacteria bacterium]|nr:GTPase ObgE [Actinomycetota bacterium]
MDFVDEATVLARAGRGGDGSASFLRQPYEPRGRPDGGSGGDGGSVVLEVSTGIRDLRDLRDHPHRRGEDGANGQGKDRDGARGGDLVVPVPDGTIVRDERGLVADLVGEGSRVVVARGGRGGRGNAARAGSRNRAPRTAERGEPGEEHRLELELRVVADVGLVGLPNAGKSTLLAALTAARPKVAAYPFTTLTPNLGVAGDPEGEGQRFVLADVPGLIEGAHEGRGLGHRFLRHVSRCRALAMVVDLAGEDPSADLATVRAELAAYDPSMAERPSVIAATKVDLLDEAERARRAGALAGEVLEVSGVSGEGVERLGVRLGDLAGEAAAAEPERTPYVVLRPGRDPFTVSREGGGFRVRGRVVERWVAETDFDDPGEIRRLQRRLAREGVERRLAEEGARRGDDVTIGDRAFEFFPGEEVGDGG